MVNGWEAALARHRTFSLAALAVLTLIAWAWLVAGAGTGMAPGFSLAPPHHPGGMADHIDGMAMPWSPLRTAAIFAMWWVMMMAMMLPSAAPTILLYARAAARSPAAPATGSFLAGYLLAWGAFSLAAALLQLWLEQAGFIASALMALSSRAMVAALLIGVGVYQFSPLKDLCLRHCRSPAIFLSRHYRPGAAGALRMGLRHGSYCVGCCWMLMALLFVGGVMNLAWIALLTLIVASEKLLPLGRTLARAAGIGCIAWGAAILLR